MAERISTLERLAIGEELASSLRHDARNRLASVRNAAFYLRRRAEKSDLWTSDARVPQFFDLIEREVASFEELLATTFRAAVPPPRAVVKMDVGQCLDDALRAAALPAEVEVVRAGGPVETEVEPLEMALGLRCLIENAAEAMGERGRLLASVREADERVLVVLEDSGPGIAEKERENVFAPFYTTKPGHAGLGLNLARRVARRQGGDLELGRGAAGGCSVTFALPALQRETAPARPRVLLVEDDAGNRLTMQALLECDGYEVETAGSLAEGRALLGGGARFALVLLDRSLPDGLSDELVPEIRQLHRRAKVVLVSGSAGVSGEDAIGYDLRIDKGADVSALLERLAAILR